MFFLDQNFSSFFVLYFFFFFFFLFFSFFFFLMFDTKFIAYKSFFTMATSNHSMSSSLLFFFPFLFYSFNFLINKQQTPLNFFGFQQSLEGKRKEWKISNRSGKRGGGGGKRDRVKLLEQCFPTKYQWSQEDKSFQKFSSFCFVQNKTNYFRFTQSKIFFVIFKFFFQFIFILIFFFFFWFFDKHKNLKVKKPLLLRNDFSKVCSQKRLEC